MPNSEQIKDRFIEIVNSNELEMNHELEIFKALFDKYNFRPIKRFADDSNISPQWIYQQIKDDKQQVIVKNGFIMCF